MKQKEASKCWNMRFGKISCLRFNCTSHTCKLFLQTVKLKEELVLVIDTELQKFREKIKCLEDELGEKIAIISDLQDMIDMKTNK